jgi:hypothetical protein
MKEYIFISSHYCDSTSVKIIAENENDVYIQKIRYFSLEAKCNNKSIQRIIHCPCCDKNIVVEELKPELNKN